MAGLLTVTDIWLIVVQICPPAPQTTTLKGDGDLNMSISKA